MGDNSDFVGCEKEDPAWDYERNDDMRKEYEMTDEYMDCCIDYMGRDNDYKIHFELEMMLVDTSMVYIVGDTHESKNDLAVAVHDSKKVESVAVVVEDVVESVVEAVVVVGVEVGVEAGVEAGVEVGVDGLFEVVNLKGGFLSLHQLVFLGLRYVFRRELRYYLQEF